MFRKGLRVRLMIDARSMVGCTRHTLVGSPLRGLGDAQLGFARRSLAPLISLVRDFSRGRRANPPLSRRSDCRPSAISGRP